ncbi:MAG: hypothetical protein RL754_1254 [Bacteroidota bacterium]|jgi:cell division protein FtsI (penicillin-binding protein 3)
MSNDELKTMKGRITWISAGMYLVFLIIAIKLFYVSLAEGPELRASSKERVLERREIPAKRGDIYSADGKTLATTKPVYDLRFDAVTIKEEVFEQEVAGLAAELAKINPIRNARSWEQYLRNAREQRNRYLLIAQDVNFSELQKARQFPIFNRGMFQGGLIVEETHERIQMATNMQLRTIGYDKEGASAGLEGYYSEYLQGKPGNRLMQKIAGGDWKPLEDPEYVEPVDGFDLITTINTRIQDVAQQSLLAQLKKYEADHGSVIVMEVATGKIVAMANLGRDKDSIYRELRNYAVWETTEPGSTFKLISAMALLETGVADTNSTVDTEGGVFKIYDAYVRDSNKKGYGKNTSLSKAFEVSSNTGIVKFVYENFKDDPEKFIDFLYRLGVNEKTGVSIKGESAPVIPKPGDANWSGLTLPWMAYGYSLSMTPLQMLTIYNAVANNGTMVRPQVVERIMDHGRVAQDFEVDIMKSGICSKETIEKLQAMLKGVVKQGTATNIFDEKNPVAGKTGTCQMNYWRKGGGKDYQSSFAGYFPADNPKYSCIVVINKPNPQIGFYGNTVAGPVFKTIADEVHSQMPQTAVEVRETELALLDPQSTQTSKITRALEQNYLPSLSGLNARTATLLMEEAGKKVSINGVGRVVAQEPAVGTALNQCSTIKLVLR